MAIEPLRLFKTLLIIARSTTLLIPDCFWVLCLETSSVESLFELTTMVVVTDVLLFILLISWSW
jgi:hypothetical protein